jgi:hypothetical protein
MDGRAANRQLQGPDREAGDQAAAGHLLRFLEFKDGDTVPTKLTVRFGLREMGVAPAGLDRPNSGHHHLLINIDLPS